MGAKWHVNIVAIRLRKELLKHNGKKNEKKYVYYFADFPKDIAFALHLSTGITRQLISEQIKCYSFFYGNHTPS
jgi:hypothetical protein